jgi:hypothetical protein
MLGSLRAPVRAPDDDARTLANSRDAESEGRLANASPITLDVAMSLMIVAFALFALFALTLRAYSTIFFTRTVPTIGRGVQS